MAWVSLVHGNVETDMCVKAKIACHHGSDLQHEPDGEEHVPPTPLVDLREVHISATDHLDNILSHKTKPKRAKGE
jgi:hypothetical protein